MLSGNHLSCNLRCLHCYNESGVLQGQIDMPTFMSIINDLPDHPDTSITISGGEPTSHPEFWDFMEALQKKQFGMVLVIAYPVFRYSMEAGCVRSSMPALVQSAGLADGLLSEPGAGDGL
ncbi:radical SAM protein [Paenibacillus sp. FSL R7-0179]|uniref:radical SAM protein n=1 Tax=Paenibacillus sp. FSL R7-0179 TaxID=2921672 RepID=UPI0030F76B21